jgi:hypothetical protein
MQGPTETTQSPERKTGKKNPRWRKRKSWTFWQQLFKQNLSALSLLFRHKTLQVLYFQPTMLSRFQQIIRVNYSTSLSSFSFKGKRVYTSKIYNHFIWSETVTQKITYNHVQSKLKDTKHSVLYTRWFPKQSLKWLKSVLSYTYG